MQPTTTLRPSSRTGDRVGALALVTIGALVIAGLFGAFETYLVLVIGLVALAAFAVTREYGFAVAGAIMTGLGTAFSMMAQGLDPSAAGHTFMLSLGGAFTGVWLLGLAARPAERHPWPLVPAAVFLTIGIGILTEMPAIIDLFMAGVAIAIVGAGVVAFVRSSR
jgi:hypothetical protein